MRDFKIDLDRPYVNSSNREAVKQRHFCLLLGLSVINYQSGRWKILVHVSRARDRERGFGLKSNYISACISRKGLKKRAKQKGAKPIKKEQSRTQRPTPPNPSGRGRGGRVVGVRYAALFLVCGHVRVLLPMEMVVFPQAYLGRSRAARPHSHTRARVRQTPMAAVTAAAASWVCGARLFSSCDHVCARCCR